MEYKTSAVAEMGDRLTTIDMGRKEGAAVPLSGGDGPHLTQCGLDPWADIYLRTKCILIHLALWPHMGQKVGVLGDLVSHLTQCRGGRRLPPYQVAWHSSSRLATTENRRRLGRAGCVPLGGEWAQCGQGRGLPPYQVAS